MQLTLPPETRSRYNEDGFYLVAEPVFPADIVEGAVRGMDAIRRGDYDTGRSPCESQWKPGDDPGKLCKIENPQFASRAVMDLVKYPALGEIAACITGARMIQAWWVQLLYKPSTDQDLPAATNIGIHQDRAYWGAWEDGSELFTAWVALSNVEEDCGPMEFARGSHKWGLRNEGNFFDHGQNVADQRRSISIPEGERWDEVSAILRPGAVSFHHCLTFHGSGPNYSGRPRRSFAIHMRTENSRPVNDLRQGLTAYIDQVDLCPVIYGRL